MLDIHDLHVFYGEIHALKGVSLAVGKGEIVALLGPNGAGKSTTVKTISGLIPARRGRVALEGEDLLGLAAHDIVHRGVSHSPEGRRIFNRLSVLENLEMGAYTRNDPRVRDDIERVFTLFPRLRERHVQVAGTLSGGEQQMLAIGRALMANPRLLLLDEPSMGLAPAVVDAIFERIHQLHHNGLTVLRVEQRAAEALETCDHGYVLETGRVAMEGTHKTLMSDERVRRAYLGM